MPKSLILKLLHRVAPSETNAIFGVIVVKHSANKLKHQLLIQRKKQRYGLIILNAWLRDIVYDDVHGNVIWTSPQRFSGDIKF